MSLDIREYSCTVSQVQLLELNIDNSVISADVKLFPGAVGLLVVAVNGISVSNRSELRDELQRIATVAHGDTLVKLGMSSNPNAHTRGQPAATVAAGDIAVLHKKDEFDDLDSDDEGHGTIQVKTQLSAAAVVEVESGSAEDVLASAAARIQPGRCIILLCEGVNPAVQVEGAAQRHKANVMHIDPVARIKTRQRLEEYAATLRKSLEKGVWIFIENATKSITLLEQLAECLRDVEDSGKLNPLTRILLMCEPHPHFPAALLEGSLTLRMRPSTATTGITFEGLSESRMRMTILKDTQDATTPQQQPATSHQKRRVKIATQVEVVKIESSAFLEMSASAIPPCNDVLDNPGTADGSKGIERIARFRFGPTEKMISLCKVPDDRFAVGTSSGYVVVLDKNGLPMIQYRPHKACIWDVAFASSYDFATASEDGTSSVFRYDLAAQELEAASVASFQSDVFAVRYAREGDPTSAVLSGGLSATVCVLHSDRKSSSFIPATTSIQALCCIPSRGHMLVGGGNGAITVIDPDTCKIVETSSKHSRKVPAVAANSGSMLLTGSFDKTLRVWDYRSQLHCSHNLVMADVLTAVALSDTHAAACSGSNLFLWDLRNLQQVLAVKNKAWNGLTRGLVIQGNMLVTASVDGAARFWQF